MSATYIPQKKAARVFPPGRFIARELEERGWSQADFAIIIGKTESKVSELVNGKRLLTVDVAQILASTFGTSAMFWMNLSSIYQLSLLEENKHAEEVALKSQLYDLLPISELVSRGWLPMTSKIEELKSAVLSFLGIKDIDSPIQYNFCFKRSTCVRSEERAKRAWCKIVEHKAYEILPKLGEYNNQSAKIALRELIPLMEEPADISKVSDILRKNGIAFIFEKHLKNTGIDGACCLLDKHPVIAITLRYDFLDSFWFTLMHELVHCMNGDFENEQQIESINEETVNKVTQEIIISEEEILKLCSNNKRPRLQEIREIAKKLHRHPSLVLGQLWKKGILDYKVGSNIRVKASKYLDVCA